MKPRERPPASSRWSYQKSGNSIQKPPASQYSLRALLCQINEPLPTLGRQKLPSLS